MNLYCFKLFLSTNFDFNYHLFLFRKIILATYYSVTIFRISYNIHKPRFAYDNKTKTCDDNTFEGLYLNLYLGNFTIGKRKSFKIECDNIFNPIFILFELNTHSSFDTLLY